MRYFLVSFLLHGLLLAFVFYRQSSSFMSQTPTNVVVELYVPANEPQSSSDELSYKEPPAKKPKEVKKKLLSQEPSVKPKSTSKTIEKAPLSEKESTDNALSSMSETERFLKSQEGKKMMASYVQQLKLYLEQNKRYPRTALRLRQSGTVKIRLKIKTDGEFGEVEVISPSPFKILNNAAVDLLKGLGRFKPLPEKLDNDEEFVIPIAYQLKKGRL